MKKIIVCGGKDFAVAESDASEEKKKAAKDQRDFLWQKLFELSFLFDAESRSARDSGDRFITIPDSYAPKNLTIIHGGSIGAEAAASEWAKRYSIAELVFPRNPETGGEETGANQQMLAQDGVVAVISFYGGKSTEDLLLRARAAGLVVYDI